MEQPDLTDLLPDHLKEGVAAGVYVVSDPKTWMFPDRPVVRDAKTKGIVKGSGKVTGSKNAAEASKQSAFKRRRSYQDLKEKYINPDDKRDAEAIMSFKELMDLLIDACIGSPQSVACTHCGDKFQVAFKKDAATLFKLWENYIGKARETSDVNVNSQHLVAILNEHTPVNEITVRAIDVTERQERTRMIEEAT